MSNVTVQRLGDEAQLDNDPHRLDYIRRDQYDRQITAARLGYREIAALGIVLVPGWLIICAVLWLIYGISSWGVYQWTTGLWVLYCLAMLCTALPLIVVALLLSVFTWRWVARTRAEVLRARVTRDRYSNPIDAQAVIGKTAEQNWRELTLATQAEITMAPYKQLPAGLDSLSSHYHYDNKALPVEQQDTALLDLPQLPPVDSMDLLIGKGYIRNSDYSLFVGHGDGLAGKPIVWKWSRDSTSDDPVIAAVAGAPGTGKTYTARFLIAQAAYKGIKLFLCDPQGGSNSPQALTYGCKGLRCHIAVTDEDIASTVYAVYSIGKARAEGRDESNDPVLLVIDEFAGQMQENPRRDDIAKWLTLIAQQYRKFNIRVLLIAQSWRAKIVGGEQGATLRNLIRLKVIHASPNQEVQFLTYNLESEDIAKIENLEQGWAFAYAPGLRSLVKVPSIQEDAILWAIRTTQPSNDALLTGLLEVAPEPAPEPAKRTTVEDKVLDVLEQYPTGWLSARDIANELGYDTTRVVRDALDKLLGKGQVQQQKQTQNGRGATVYSVSEG